MNMFCSQPWRKIICDCVRIYESEEEKVEASYMMGCRDGGSIRILLYRMLIHSNQDHSSKITHVIWPAISTWEAMPVNLPVATSRFRKTTRPSPCSPTPAIVPALFSEKWRGTVPPAGYIWTKLSAPVVWSIEYVMMGSEGICVEFLASKLVMLNVFSPLEEIIRNLLSGFNLTC